MQTLSRVFALTLAIIFTSGCASMSQPKRTVYNGPDNIGSATPEMLIGHWSVKLLNPIEGESVADVKANYKSDGTVVMNVLPQQAGNPMGTIALEMAGVWSIEGDNVAVQLTSMKETSGNKMASMIIGMMGNMKEKMGGKANIYEASSNRVVLVSDEGQAQELTRIQ